MCSIHTYTHTYTHKHTHWIALTLSVVCRWPSFNALEKWFDCASSAAQFAAEFLYKLGLPLMASSTSPSHLLTPALLWQWEGERVLCVCFKFMIWNVTLKSESGEISFAFAFASVLACVFWFHLFACLRFAWHFTFAALIVFFFYFFIFSCVALLLTNIFVFFFSFFFCILLSSLLISFLFVRSLGLLVCGICWWCRVVCQACEKMLR